MVKIAPWDRIELLNFTQKRKVAKIYDSSQIPYSLFHTARSISALRDSFA
jgi:hypothetical protein